LPSLSLSESNRFIFELVVSGAPALVARFGSTELRAIRRHFLRSEEGLIEKIRGLLIEGRMPFFSRFENRRLFLNSGFYPVDPQTVRRFSMLIRASLPRVDLLGSWAPGEAFFSEELKQARVTRLGNLEPFFAKNPWTYGLAGKRVLVIHPFARTIRTQYENARELLFQNPGILPSFDLDTLTAVQSRGSTDGRFRTWFDALEWMRGETLRRNFDVALVGCGAYGLPLAAMVKEEGRTAIHLGGATQLLFGIKGARWDQRESIRALYNNYWVRPSEDEVPAGARGVDGRIPYS